MRFTEKMASLKSNIDEVKNNLQYKVPPLLSDIRCLLQIFTELAIEESDPVPAQWLHQKAALISSAEKQLSDAENAIDDAVSHIIRAGIEVKQFQEHFSARAENEDGVENNGNY